MKYLHLSGAFTPTPKGDLDCISNHTFTFKGGEPHVKINVPDVEEGDEVMITLRPVDFADIGLLLLAVDALRRLRVGSISLFMPYFPGARQDRTMVAGEPLTSKVYAELINGLYLDEIMIMDPHSDVTPALLDSCTVISNHEFINAAIEDIWVLNGDAPEFQYSLISPDNGSNKKVKAFHKWELEVCGAEPLDDGLDIIFCDKTRDVSTGKITGFEVGATDLTDKICIIVDDICDGGGTFIGLAKELKNKSAAQVYLIVTHGIFSNGFEGLNEHIDGVYCTDSFFQEIYADAGTGPTCIHLTEDIC